MQNRLKKFPLCFSSKLLADLCTHFTPNPVLSLLLKGSSEKQLMQRYWFMTFHYSLLLFITLFITLYKIRRSEMLLQSPAPCSSDSTVQHYENLPCNFLRVNRKSNPVKTPQYNASRLAPSFSCDYVLYPFSSVFPRQWRQFRCTPSPTALLPTPELPALIREGT